MNPSDPKDPKNKIPYLSSRAFLDAQRLASNPDIVALHDISKKIPKIQAAQIARIPPGALAACNAIPALKGMDIAHINSFLGQLDQIPDEDFKVIRQTVTQNRSEIRDAAKANYETAADIVKKASENNTDGSIVFSEPVGQLLTDADDSIELPKPDTDKRIHFPLIRHGIGKAISIILTVSTISNNSLSTYQYFASTELSKQQHAEVMWENRKQTLLQEKQLDIDMQRLDTEKKRYNTEKKRCNIEEKRYNIEKRAFKYLKQIAENIAHNNDVSQ